MRPKSTAIVVAGTLAVGVGAGYLGTAARNPQPASAQSPPAKSQSSADSMMGGNSGSMMTEMMDAEHAKMMREPAMREMHQAMVRKHSRMMRDPATRRLENRLMRRSPEMAAMMRKHMRG